MRSFGAGVVGVPSLHFSQADGYFIPALCDHSQIVKVLKHPLIMRDGEDYAPSFASFIHDELFPAHTHTQLQKKDFSFLSYICLAAIANIGVRGHSLVVP